MYRVLHIMDGANVGGISSVVLNYYRFIDRSLIQFDFAFTNPGNNCLIDEFKGNGGKIHKLPLKSSGLRVYIDSLISLLKKEKYDAVHVHENETSYVALWAAKKAGIKKRYAHAHTSSPYVSIKGELKRLSGCVLNYHYATKVIGCGQLAGERVFGKFNMQRKKAVVLPNAVDVEAFAFDADVRYHLRQKMELEGKYIVGMVGRLAPVKNCLFALRVIKQFHECNPNVVILLIGTGEDESRIQSVIENEHIGEYVKLLGMRRDVSALYQVLDVLMIPSLHEGFPVVAVEAMANGLPVMLSSSITKELSFGSAVRYIDLDKEDAWLQALQSIELPDKNREVRGAEVQQHGFDIRQAVNKLETIYLGN